jgi:transposase
MNQSQQAYPTDLNDTEWSRIAPYLAEGQKGFQVLPKRWVVERTFTWISRYRRLAWDYERLAATSEALIYIAMIRLGLRRLART